ncbi:uncharacterized protein LOC114519354 [Dendronephthya gigantea]|uniref:uncharacterized protein LOC114519354 n=1 Tax=Dendronephthya gigantea TaxID=151771 RepID=UPI00106CDF17|nr:uncharacterized protein LOC114519354 [Dendronephthya gigantea]
MADNMQFIASLFDLATNVFVRYVKTLKTYSEYIPVTLYDSLLKASLKTNRLLSTRHILLSWPFRELSLVNCDDFKEEHAVILAYSLYSTCKNLRVVDLTGCNIGIYGTTFILTLVLGQALPDVSKYCSKEDTTMHLPQPRLTIKTDCYISRRNYSEFLDVLEGYGRHNFIVSYFYGIGLGQNGIRRILTKLHTVQAESVLGLDLQMNRLLDIKQDRSLWNFSNLQYLDLSYTALGLHTICRILKHLESPLKHLLLNGIQSRRNFPPYFDFHKMMQFSCVQRLERFELGSYFGEIGPDFFAFLRNCCGTLLVLSLRNNYLKDASIADLLKLLEPPFRVSTLYLDANTFSIAGVKLLRKCKNIVL